MQPTDNAGLSVLQGPGSMHGIRAWMHRVVNDIVRAGDGTAASNDERRRLYVHVGCAGWHRGVVGHGDEILSYPRGLRHLYRLCCVLYTLFLCLSAPTTLRWLQLRRAGSRYSPVPHTLLLCARVFVSYGANQWCGVRIHDEQHL